jgi:hypothetical protein
VEHGYRAVLVDPQHGSDSDDGKVARLACTVEEAFEPIGDLIRSGCVAFVAGFPPCTDMAVSGARWFHSKYEADHLFQARAVSVAEQCRVIGELSGAPWFVENPVSVLSRVFGKPDHTFHPFDYTRLAPDDNYRKLTCLWVGNGYHMPPPNRDLSLGEPDERIHLMPPGPQRANLRSRTPLGFSKAVYAAHCRGVGQEK